jgi:uncharacterized membrane protein
MPAPIPCTVMIRDPLMLAGLIAALTALAFWLDRRIRLLSRIGAALIAIVLGAALSNAGLVPADSPVYDAVTGPVTSLAIAWLLLSVNLADIRRAGPRVIGAFGLACAGTAAGALVGAAVFTSIFGDDTWRLAGTLTGTYTGGSLNFVGVGRALGLEGPLFAGATAADNLTTGLWLGATLLLPLWLGRFYPRPAAAIGGADAVVPEPAADRHVGHPHFTDAPLSTLSLSILLAAGLALLILANALAARVPAVPAVVWLTTLALLAGHLTPLRGAPGTLQLGGLALTGFFVVIGIHSRVLDIVAVGFEVFWLTLVIVLVHGLVVFGIGRLVRLDVATLAVASQAAVGGPSSALAVAVGRGWRGLVLPGIMVGLLGYAVGTYLGIGVGMAVRGLGW